MAEPMSAERLVGLRETADLARDDPYAVVADGGEVVELIDRVRCAEAALTRVVAWATEPRPEGRLFSNWQDGVEASKRAVLAAIRVTAVAGQAEGQEFGPRPAGCCGKCPPIVGGYDCTCNGNPRCGQAEGDARG